MIGAVLLLAGCAATPDGEHDQPAAADAAAQHAGVPPPARARFERALSLMQEQSYREAEPLLRALAADHPALAGPPANLGIVYSETQRAGRAEQSFRRALERKPDSAAVYNQLGVLYRRAGKFEQAREAYRQALAVEPGYADAHLNLGILLELYLLQPEAALAHYRSYQRLAGEDREVALWIVDLERRLQDAGRRAAGGES